MENNRRLFEIKRKLLEKEEDYNYLFVQDLHEQINKKMKPFYISYNDLKNKYDEIENVIEKYVKKMKGKKITKSYKGIKRYIWDVMVSKLKYEDFCIIYYKYD